MRVAIQGSSGSFSEAAARRRWPRMSLVSCREVAQVVAAVREGRADAGCLAIENSLFGSVTATYDLLHEAFGDGTLCLQDEILLPVHHALVGVPGAAITGIRRVLSHPVALGQCRHWLSGHIPRAELVNEWDTAGSGEIVAREGRADQAAIVPLDCAGMWSLSALAERIEDDPSNQTRFLTFARAKLDADSEGPERRKTSLLIWLAHRPGTLASALQVFASRGINLTSLQSRPERTVPWAYRFYVDVEGGAGDARVAEALEALEAIASRVVVLGSYREWNDGTARRPRSSASLRGAGRKPTSLARPAAAARRGHRKPGA